MLTLALNTCHFIQLTDTIFFPHVCHKNEHDFFPTQFISSIELFQTALRFLDLNTNITFIKQRASKDPYSFFLWLVYPIMKNTSCTQS